MFRRIQSRRSREGFTLIELLIVVAIIGIIAVILIPNLLDALQKAKQKSTTADMREIMQAFFSWTTDEAGAAAAGTARTFTLADFPDGAEPADLNDLRNLLVPVSTAAGQIRYIQNIPTNDGWGNPFEYYVQGTAADPQPLQAPGFAIRSFGKDGAAGCATTYTDPCPAAGLQYPVGAFPSSQYDQDIVGADGYFVRWPAGAQTVATD